MVREKSLLQRFQENLEPPSCPAYWGTGVFMGGETGLGGDHDSSPLERRITYLLLGVGDEAPPNLCGVLPRAGCDPQSDIPSPGNGEP